ncbi:MAG: hypothetical protein ACE14T_12540 [Syntrophales bacterium]
MRPVAFWYRVLIIQALRERWNLVINGREEIRQGAAGRTCLLEIRPIT